MNIARYELLEIDDVDPVSQSNILSQAFGGSDAFTQRNNQRLLIVTQILAAFFQQAFGGTGGDVNAGVANVKIAGAVGPLVVLVGVVMNKAGRADESELRAY